MRKNACACPAASGTASVLRRTCESLPWEHESAIETATAVQLTLKLGTLTSLVGDCTPAQGAAGAQKPQWWNSAKSVFTALPVGSRDMTRGCDSSKRGQNVWRGTNGKPVRAKAAQ